MLNIPIIKYQDCNNCHLKQIETFLLLFAYDFRQKESHCILCVVTLFSLLTLQAFHYHCIFSFCVKPPPKKNVLKGIWNYKIYNLSLITVIDSMIKKNIFIPIAQLENKYFVFKIFFENIFFLCKTFEYILIKTIKQDNSVTRV